MKDKFEQQSEEHVTKESKDSVSSEALPEPSVHIGVEDRLPYVIKEVLQERDISYRLIPMTDMWLGNPMLFRMERDETGKAVEKRIAAGVTDVIQTLQSDKFFGIVSENDGGNGE